MSHENKVVAVIVTYNRSSLLEQVVNALARQSHPLYKILIVDNNSADDTKQIVSKLTHCTPQIEYVNTGDNLGGAGGFFYGVKLAKKYNYDYIWLMDDDLVPNDDCLEKLLDVGFDGIRQPVRYYSDGTCAEISPVQYDLSSIFLINPKRKTVADLLKEGRGGRDVDLHGVPFEGPLISKCVVNKIGFPESKFFIFYDDLDYSIRARRAGFDIKCICAARAIRLFKNNQSNDLKSWKGYFMLRNLFYIHKKYGENWFVKKRPLFITLAYLLLSIMQLNLKQARIVIQAFNDSKLLKNSHLHRPEAITKMVNN